MDVDASETERRNGPSEFFNRRIFLRFLSSIVVEVTKHAKQHGDRFGSPSPPRSGTQKPKGPVNETSDVA